MLHTQHFTIWNALMKVLRIAVNHEKALSHYMHHFEQSKFFKRVVSRLLSRNHTISILYDSTKKCLATDASIASLQNGLCTADQIEIYCHPMSSKDKKFPEITKRINTPPLKLSEAITSIFCAIFKESYQEKTQSEQINHLIIQTHQILGIDLESPCDALITWFDPNLIEKNYEILLCEERSIPVFNLFDKDNVQNEIKVFLEKNEV